MAMRFPRFLSCLFVVTLALLPSMVRAQERIVLKDAGISFIRPAEFTPVPAEKLQEGLLYELRGNWSQGRTTHQDSQLVVTMHLIDSIDILELPKNKNGLRSNNDLPTERDINGLREIMRQLIPGIIFQDSAAIKVAGRDAFAVRISLSVEGLPEEATGRIVFVADGDRTLLFVFATTNDVFSVKVPGFEKLMGSLHFLADGPLPTAPKPTPKPTVKPTKKGKR